MSEDTKKKVREDCEMSLAHFQLIMSKLRKNRVIVNNKINPRFISQITEGMESFPLLINFDFK